MNTTTAKIWGPGISVILPTWGRPDETYETGLHLLDQLHRPLELLVSVDGDAYPNYYGVLAKLKKIYDGTNGLTMQGLELGWRMTEELPNSFAMGALMNGVLHAKHPYHTWFCDDEKAAPDHLSSLMALIQQKNVDFVYPKVYLWRPSDPDGGLDIGLSTPMFGHFTTALYHRRVLSKGMYRFLMPKQCAAEPVPHDWDLASQWVRGGASWAMLDRVTMSHRADH